MGDDNDLTNIQCEMSVVILHLGNESRVLSNLRNKYPDDTEIDDLLCEVAFVQELIDYHGFTIEDLKG